MIYFPFVIFAYASVGLNSKATWYRLSLWKITCQTSDTANQYANEMFGTGNSWSQG